MKNLRIISIAMAIAIGALSYAQGQGRGGMRQMGGGQSPAMLLNRNDVKADLKLTDEQKDGLTKIQEATMAKMQEMGGGFGRGGGERPSEEEMAAMREKMQVIQKESEAAVKKVLTTAQWDRLGEIRVQIMGNGIVTDKDMQKTLKMTEAQLAKVKTLQEGMQAANQAVMQRMRDGELEREGAMETMTKNREALNAEYGKVLTTEQKEMLKKMGGAAFKADPEEANRGGFGRRGGGN